MKLHTFLFDRLWQAGVRHIFGIPGDFALNLFEALEDDGRFEVVRLSHEPAVGFAADGAARATSGLGVCCVTYGAGGLNMVNAVACAYAEESPILVISGGPGALPAHFDTTSYQSTHITGGTIMGADPDTSVVNNYLQMWGVDNLFAVGAGNFPQNAGFNPTGTVGALAYRAAEGILKYHKSGGSLV